jgi:ribosomal protein S18 acetylase RimI-like enzyme
VTIEVDARGTHRVLIDTPIEIRHSTAADLEPLSGLWGIERRVSQRRVLRRYFDEQHQAIQAGLVATFNGAIVGQIWVRHRNLDRAIADGKRAAYLHSLVVIEQFRRLGIGEALTRAASQEAESHGAEVLTIGVDAPNSYARKLYEQWGFQAYRATTDLRGALVFLRRPTSGVSRLKKTKC